MIFLMGITGFVGGFLLGQMILSFLLRGKSRDDILKIMQDPGKKLRYGMITWLCAFMGAYCFLSTYKRYLTG